MTADDVLATLQVATAALQRCETKAKGRLGYAAADWQTVAAALQDLACADSPLLHHIEFRAHFRATHSALHRRWSADVGQPDYVKQDWIAIDNALARLARDRATRIGIATAEALL